jgi:hypothetical protein
VLQKLDFATCDTKTLTEEAHWSLLGIVGCGGTHHRLLERVEKVAVTDAEILI